MDYFPALNVFLFVVSLSSSILDWSFFKCLRNGREVDLVQADCSQDWVGTGRLPPPAPHPSMAGRPGPPRRYRSCQPSKQAESGSAHG